MPAAATTPSFRAFIKLVDGLGWRRFIDIAPLAG
jgi:hypothetical protein